ncbi:JmjC domain-containing protein [Streptomyces carpaticus]|uniref:Ribosomal oxygenase 2 n=1 Tax=Streptomyces carpaticus TaxID=285558 RepID=A0ABV4ZRR5_9ACTN
MALAALIDDAERFLDAWPTTPHLFHRPPDSFRSLLTREEVDDLIDHDCLGLRNLALLKENRPVEPFRYTDGDTPRRGALRRHLEEGGTLSLRHLERLKPSLAVLHRELVAETGYAAHINAYYTPAGAQGLKYHYDPYLTLIVQLSGSKAWPTHRPFVANPVRGHLSFHQLGFTAQQRHYLEHEAPEETYTLRPGDVLWLPRGYVHAPYTVGDEPSLHLTIALKERTWHWVAGQLTDAVLDRALRDPAMRAAVAPREITTNPDRAVREMRAYLVGALLTLDRDAMAGLIREAALRPE